MIRIIILTAGVIFFCWSAQAEDFNFETTSDGIIRKLTGADKGMKIRGIRGGKWKDAFETDKPNVSRAIRVIHKEGMWRCGYRCRPGAKDRPVR